MRVLLTGGSGLIGRALTRSLLQNGHQVVVLTRRPQKTADLLPPETKIQVWDGRTPEGWAHLVEETEAVIHLAGESIAGENLTAILTRRWTEDYKTRILQSRVQSGQALVSAITRAQNRPRVFLQASAVGYYGHTAQESVDESAPPGEGFLAQVCQRWEASTAALEELGMRRVILRTGLVLSSTGGILPIMLLPIRYFVGGALGNGKQAVPWIHLQDETEAIRFLMEKSDTSGAYNLCAPHPVEQREFARAAARIMRRPALMPTPGLLLKLALGEKASLILEGQRALPQRLLQSGYRFRFADLETALNDLLGKPASAR